MVHLELGKSNAGMLKIAGDLAERFGAGIIGIVACKPLMAVYAGDFYYSGDVIGEERAEVAREASEAEVEFRTALAHIADLQWRSAITAEPLCEYLAREGRSADLIVTAMDRPPLLADTRHTSVGDLVMRAGRPVIVVPPGASHIGLDRVLVAWKESRESRRAALDALPLLKRAGHVTVAELASLDDLPAARERLADVAAWLGRHGVTAEPLAVPSHGGDASTLAKLAHEQQADMLVAGAYGHSRLREWAFGGVTYDLLLDTPRAAFLSH
jgi:nucleotide-binding universal stress UspA family protein